MEEQFEFQRNETAQTLSQLATIIERKEMRDLPITISLIRSANSSVRKSAIAATVAIIRFAIIENYHQLGTDGRKKLAEIIDRIDPDTITELQREVQVRDDEHRIHALMILGLFRRRALIRNIIEKELKSTNPKVRATAVQALGNQPDSSEHIMLLKQLNDSDNRVRANAIEALMQFKDPKLAFSLKRLLNDGNNRVRANALKALYELGNEQIEDDVLSMLEEKSSLMIASGLWLVSILGLDTPELRSRCSVYKGHPDPMIIRNFARVAEHYHWQIQTPEE